MRSPLNQSKLGKKRASISQNKINDLCHLTTNAVKNRLRSKEETGNTLTDKAEQVTFGMELVWSFFKEIQTTNTIFRLFKGVVHF